MALFGNFREKRITRESPRILFQERLCRQKLLLSRHYVTGQL